MFYIPKEWEIYPNHTIPHNDLAHTKQFKRNHNLCSPIKYIENKLLVNPTFYIDKNKSYKTEDGITVDTPSLHEKAMSNGFTVIEPGVKCLRIYRTSYWTYSPDVLKLHGAFRLAWLTGRVTLEDKEVFNPNGFLEKSLKVKDLKPKHSYLTTAGTIYYYLGKFNYIEPIFNRETNGYFVSEGIIKCKIKKSSRLYICKSVYASLFTGYNHYNSGTEKQILLNNPTIRSSKPKAETVYDFGEMDISKDEILDSLRHSFLSYLSFITVSKSTINIPDFSEVLDYSNNELVLKVKTKSI
jgi:hypothetical protein